MKKTILLLLISLSMGAKLFAQKTEIKNYPTKTYAGDALLASTYGEMVNGVADKVFVFSVTSQASYDLGVLINLQYRRSLKVYIDRNAVGAITGDVDGWQTIGINNISLTSGKHEIRFAGYNAIVPMADEISITRSGGSSFRAKPEWSNFINTMRQLEQAPVGKFRSATEIGDITNTTSMEKVLPNPLGNYDHAIDTMFNYTHYSTVYLSVGNHTFTTSGSTINRALTVFNQSNYTYSWSNVNSGPGGESGLYLYVGLAGYYSVMLRPVTDGQTGTTNIILDGSTIASNATIGGRRIGMSSLKGGNKFLNFFTCRLSAGDTRLIISRYPYSSAQGYNDDYYGGGGDWYWGLSSRIKKKLGTDSVQYGFVCAYSPTSGGLADIYLGNDSSNVTKNNYPEFPLLQPDDAILASIDNAGYYNCISWSGGITSTWVWPPSSYSTYNCTNSDMDIACFDHFYGNSPVRYPGAWNYTRTGATVNNAVVDVWALNGHFTHGSVRKPGNNHPHGYDWESKPGGLKRTFHPRNALTNDSWGYGHVVNYYIHNGTYANRMAGGQKFESDADAVKAGVAVFENAALTRGAQDKLSSLLRKVDGSFARQFDELYNAWKKTWASNAIYSDPSMYCKNAEHNAMAALAMKQPKQAMILIFEKFVTEKDHLIGDLMWTLTKEMYGKLLTEVKDERAAKPNDDAGRYKVHGDHDNGVLYVEKILKQLDDKEVTSQVNDITTLVSISPNPVQDRFAVKLQLNKAALIEVKAVSAQTGKTIVLQQSKLLTAGTYQFNGMANAFAGNTGDIITIQVMVNGEMKAYKALVTK